MRRSNIYELIDQLYVTNRLTITRLQEQLGLNHEELKRLLNTIKMLGLSLKPDIMISKMGLRSVVIISEFKDKICIKDFNDLVSKVPFVKALVYVPPNKIIVTLHIPMKIKLCQRETFIEHNVKLYTFDYVIRSKPKSYLLKQLIERGPLIMTDIATFEQLISGPINIDVNNLLTKARFDFLDIKLLSKLSKDPFISLSKLSKEMNIRPKRLETHLKHAEQFLFGYRVSKISALGPSKQSALMIVKCKHNKNICSLLIRHPCISSCGGTIKNDVYCVIVRDLGQNFGKLLHTIIEFLTSLNCELIDFEMYFLEHHFYTIMTIPSMPTDLAYIPQLRGWRKDVELYEILLEIFNAVKC